MYQQQKIHPVGDDSTCSNCLFIQMFASPNTSGFITAYKFFVFDFVLFQFNSELIVSFHSLTSLVVWGDFSPPVDYSVRSVFLRFLLPDPISIFLGRFSSGIICSSSILSSPLTIFALLTTTS